MVLTVEPLEEHDESAYEEYLAAQTGALLYYSLGYRRLLQRLLDCRAIYLVAREGRRIRGVLPLMVRSGPLGEVYNSLPYYGSHGAPLADSLAVRNRLAGAAVDLCARPGTVSMVCIENPFAPAGELPLPRDWLRLADYRIGQFTPLPGTGRAAAVRESLRARFEPSARRNIRRAGEQGIRVATESDALEFLAQVHRENMAAMGGQAKNAAFFELFPQVFEEGRDYRVYVARCGGERVAALLLFYHAGVVEYFTPVVVAECRHLQPMAAILDQAMVDAALEGHRFWNWGGTWPNQKGVFRFKRKWGAQAQRYDYQVLLRSRETLRASRAVLVAGYPGFYVVPFGALEGG